MFITHVRLSSTRQTAINTSTLTLSSTNSVVVDKGELSGLKGQYKWQKDTQMRAVFFVKKGTEGEQGADKEGRGSAWLD